MGNGFQLVDTNASTIDIISSFNGNSTDCPVGNNLGSKCAPIAFINCDSSAPTYNGDINMTGLVQKVIKAQAAGIIFYDQSTAFCNLSNTGLPTSFTTYGLFYSMTNTMDTGKLLDLLQNGNGQIRATVETQAIYQNVMAASAGGNVFGNPTPGTAVAMIILYSITGVIALLFVIIIVTGAVRAHRHPERYGPRNIGTGRVRQTRAQGIGRAMLETLPLVKFGEQRPAKPTDVELGPTNGSASTVPANEQSERSADAGTEGNATAQQSTSRGLGHVQTTTAPGAADSGVAENATHKEKIEMSLECAICWEDFSQGEEVRMLPCEHKFHPKCIDPWLLDFSGTCPVCRIEFGKPDKQSKAS